jgi:hypothetical protein
MKYIYQNYTKRIFHYSCSENSVWLGSFKMHFKLQVIYKSCRQILTSSNNSQLLLKLEILDKFRLATNQRNKDKENCNIF